MDNAIQYNGLQWESINNFASSTSFSLLRMKMYIFWSIAEMMCIEIFCKCSEETIKGSKKFNNYWELMLLLAIAIFWT